MQFAISYTLVSITTVSAEGSNLSWLEQIVPPTVELNQSSLAFMSFIPSVEKKNKNPFFSIKV